MLLAMAPFSNAAPNKMKVATTFTVIADIAANIAGDAAEVVSITKVGAEIHGYEPTPQDIVRTSNADLILWNGMNLEIWFEQFFSNLKGIPAVTVTKGIKPIPVASGAYQGKPNPHAWMGLNNALIYVDNILEAFAIHDPKNAAIYVKNATAYKEKLRKTIEPLKHQIDKISHENRWLVTCEGAFSYLAKDLGLKELYLWPINADQVGSPQQVRAVIDGVKQHKIPVIFCESTVNTAPAKQVARDTGSLYGGELFVDTLSDKNGPVPTYLDLLKVTTQTVAKGLTNAN